jgi:hypothetical protein
MKPFYGFDRKRIELVGQITLPVSFRNPKNSRTEYITFNVVDMHYPYIAIFGGALLNSFEATLHLAYLCLHVLDTFGVISVFDSQKDARNIEQDFTPCHKNDHFFREALEHHQQYSCPTDTKAPNDAKPTIEVDCEIKRVALDPRVPKKTIFPRKDLPPQEEVELLTLVDNNNDVFSW